MSSRFETITDDSLPQVLLTQPGTVYTDGHAIGMPKSFRRYNKVPYPNGWLGPGMSAPRLARLKQGYFAVLVEDDAESMQCEEDVARSERSERGAKRRE